MKQNVVKANRERTLWLWDGKNSYMVPKGWCDDWSVKAGMAGGLDFIDEGKPRPEIYCYAPTQIMSNSEVDTLFVAVADLQKLEEIDMHTARLRHPAMGKYLDDINNEGKKYIVFVVFGSTSTVAVNGKGAIYEYGFETVAEREAFILGLEEASGWSDYAKFFTRRAAEEHVGRVTDTNEGVESEG